MSYLNLAKEASCPVSENNADSKTGGLSVKNEPLLLEATEYGTSFMNLKF
jgi:hypothetical protein